MTVTYLGEIAERRTAKNMQGRRSYSRTFHVSSDSKTDTAFDAGSASGLPLIGSAYPDDANAFCKSISVACEHGYTGWLVTCEYDDKFEIEQNTPENDEVKISFTSELFQEEAWQDKDGNGVFNSAGDPYNPPLMRDDHRVVARIVKNVTSVPDYVLDFPNVVNSVPFTIKGLLVGARRAKISNVAVSEDQRRNGVKFNTVTIDIQIKRRGKTWDREVLDAGFRRLDPSDSTRRIPCLNDDETEVTEPALLDGAGAQIDDPGPTDAVFNEHRIYTEDNYVGTIPGCF